MTDLTWQAAFRVGFAPQLSDAALLHLLGACLRDDATLIQGTVSDPPPGYVCQDWPVRAACAVGYAAWRDGAGTVGELDVAFGRMCFGADQRLGKSAACMAFLNWVDDTPRAVMLPALAEECRLELERRGVEHKAALAG